MSAQRTAWLYEEFGGADKLQKKQIDIPKAGDKDVVIKVAASGTNPVDYKIRAGYLKQWPHSFPIVPGWDVSGTVESAPKDSGFTKGDEVYSYTRATFDTKADDGIKEVGAVDGTAATVVVVPAWKVAKKPESVSLIDSASVPLAALTAYQSLHDVAKIEKGQTVLILGASGGVGSFAVGIAKAAGLTVIGTCSTKNVDYVKGLGADQVVDYKVKAVSEQLDGKTIDVVFDCVGGETAEDGLKALKKGGFLVSIAHWTLKEEAEKQGKKYSSHLVSPSGEQLTELGKLIDNKQVQMPTITQLKLDEIADAQKQLETQRTRGKIVLVVGESK